MADQVVITEITRLYLGRALQGEPFGETDDQLEMSVDLYALGTDYAAAWLAWAGVTAGSGPSPADSAAWMPLTTVVAGAPELVWDAGDSLIPTYSPF